MSAGSVDRHRPTLAGCMALWMFRRGHRTEYFSGHRDASPYRVPSRTDLALDGGLFPERPYVPPRRVSRIGVFNVRSESRNLNQTRELARQLDLAKFSSRCRPRSGRRLPSRTIDLSATGNVGYHSYSDSYPQEIQL